MLNIYMCVSKNFAASLILAAIVTLTSSCGLYKKTDARDLPTSGLERAKKM